MKACSFPVAPEAARSARFRRSQAFGLAALIRNLGREQRGGNEREVAEADVERAVQADSDEAVVSTALHLARLDRGAVLPVDWSKVTGG